ncbi:MAG: hypothetical protein ABIL68_07890 [bacterium]
MKKLFVITLLCGLLFFASKSNTRPEYWEYTAIAYVYDHEDNPMPNIRVNLWVSAWDGEINLSGEANGYTNQYGYAIVTYYIDGEYDPELELMWATVINPPYSTYNAIGNRTTSSSTIYPEFWIWIDLDDDDIRDEVEVQIADKFKPVLHKHSYDKQPGLANFDDVLNTYMTLSGYTTQPQQVYNADVPPIHVWWGTGDGCSFGQGDIPTIWKLNLNDNMRYTGAVSGNRPLYYHVFRDDTYYYVQYWYFLTMNDISDMSIQHTWHEGDC